MTQPLWMPTENQIKEATLTDFKVFAEKRYKENFKDYEALHAWSIQEKENFWETLGRQFIIAAPVPQPDCESIT